MIFTTFIDFGRSHCVRNRFESARETIFVFCSRRFFVFCFFFLLWWSTPSDQANQHQFDAFALAHTSINTEVDSLDSLIFTTDILWDFRRKMLCIALINLKYFVLFSFHCKKSFVHFQSTCASTIAPKVMKLPKLFDGKISFVFISIRFVGSIKLQNRKREKIGSRNWRFAKFKLFFKCIEAARFAVQLWNVMTNDVTREIEIFSSTFFLLFPSFSFSFWSLAENVQFVTWLAKMLRDNNEH